MADNSEIFGNSKKETGFNVPNDYFESFNKRIMTQIDKQEQGKSLKPKSRIYTILRPVYFIAAIFIGVIIVSGIYVQRGNQSSHRTFISYKPAAEESAFDDILYTTVDEYTLYEYLADTQDIDF